MQQNVNQLTNLYKKIGETGERGVKTTPRPQDLTQYLTLQRQCRFYRSPNQQLR